MKTARSKPRSTSCCPPPSRRRKADPSPTGPEAELELAAFARALAHPIRVRILKLLAGRKTCVCGEIVDELPLAQSTVSEHLRILKEAGLVRGEIEGPRSCYCLEPEALARLKLLLEGI